MARHTLFAYVDGSDLDSIAADLEARFDRFVEATSWRVPRPWVVNQRHDDGPSVAPSDLPDWDLGLNVDLPDPGQEPPNWFIDVDTIARFLGILHGETGRNFIVGIADNEDGFVEDLFSVKCDNPDLQELRQIIGVGPVG
jgi:hypothetical protein